MAKLIRRWSDLSRELAPEVETLKGLVRTAWKICIMEYFQVVAMRLVDPQYSHCYFSSAIHDSVEFQKFSEELNSVGFRNRQVWRAWTYIRPLVVKYIGRDDNIDRLDKGRATSVLYIVSLSLGRFPKAASEKDRPKRKVTLKQWTQIPPTLLNGLLDEAITVCGYQEQQKEWKYDDVFGANPQRLEQLLG